MRWPKTRSRNKYNAKAVDGFPSKLEAAVYGVLKLREKQGEISDIQRQQHVILQDGPREVKISWRLDFSYVDNATKNVCYVEAKGFQSECYKLKLKLWRKMRPAKLEIYKGNYARPVLSEVIEGAE